MFAKVGKKRYYSKLDLATEESKKLIEFTSAEGLFKFKYRPIGLKAAAAVFAELMRKGPTGIPNVEH